MPNQDFPSPKHGSEPKVPPDGPSSCHESVLPPVEPTRINCSRPSITNSEPKVVAERLLKISSIEELRTAYSAHGGQSLGLDELIEMAKADWQLERDRLLKECMSLPVPATYPVIHLPDGTGLIGIMHSLKNDPKVDLLVRSELANHPTLLCEHNLGRANFGLFSHGVEIPDQCARGLAFAGMHLFVNAYKALWGHATEFCQRRLIKPKNIAAQVPAADQSKQAQELEDLKAAIGITRDPIRQSFSRVLLHMGADVINELPIKIELAYRIEKGLPFTHNQLRSAYMAYFLQAWDPSRSLEVFRPRMSSAEFDSLKNKKSFLCGLAHVPEIEFFYSQPPVNTHVAAQARKDAEVANRDIIQFERYAINRMNYAQGLALATSAAAGFALVWLYSLF